VPDIKLQKLWYVQRGDSVAGPFPEKWIQRDFLLGRLTTESLVSLDQVHWLRLDEYPELVVTASAPPVGGEDDAAEWGEERRRAALRWIDERRLLERRVPTDTPVAANKRQRSDRRQPESAEVLFLRQRHAELEAEMGRRKDRFFGVGLVLLLLLGLVVWAVVRVSPVNPVRVGLSQSVADCNAPAAPQVNWGGCDKAGAWLRGVDLSSAVLTAARFNAANLSLSHLAYANLARADLSYANLNGAQLRAVDLQRADLSYADLKNADLSLTDLRGARLDAADLTGAHLGGAIWIDGRECQEVSVGACI
jgi:hypothetical protein